MDTEEDIRFNMAVEKYVDTINHLPESKRALSALSSALQDIYSGRDFKEIQQDFKTAFPVQCRAEHKAAALALLEETISSTKEKENNAQA